MDDWKERQEARRMRRMELRAQIEEFALALSDQRVYVAESEPLPDFEESARNYESRRAARALRRAELKALLESPRST